MQVQKQWTKPELTVYGSVETITEQRINIGKSNGTGDSITLTINGNDVVVDDSDNGPLTSVSIS